MGDKTFECRKNDRGFNIGDELFLREYFPDLEDYSGRTVHCKVKYVLQGERFGIVPGFCVMGIDIIRK